jgi:hypothetical protein
MFGTRDPKKKNRFSINLEINSPIQGINRHDAGVFLEDESGDIYLGHRGNRICRVKKKVFRHHLKNGRYWRWAFVTDGHRKNEVIVLRPRLHDPLLLTAIGALVKRARRIKELVR